MTEISLTTKYDQQLLLFEAFKLRNFLLPHIGNKMSDPDGILFIMESHYIDPSFFEHQYDKINLKKSEPNLFYNIHQDNLTFAFKAYLNTRQIVHDSGSSERILAKGKSVYRKVSAVVKEALQLPNNNSNSSLDYVAIYNYFQRPSYKPGASIKLCKKDEEVAYETLMHVVNTIGISKIIFTSAKAYDSFIKIDNANENIIQANRKIFRGTHPRVWGNACIYENEITWRQWVINRLTK